MASAPEPKDPGHPVPQVAKVEFRGNLAGLPWANVFHVLYGPVGSFLSEGQAQTLADGMFTAYTAHLMPNMSQSTTLTSCDVVSLESDLGASASHIEDHPGGTAGETAKANESMVISWSISRHYRGGRPRTYLCGIPAMMSSTPNTWAAQYVSQFKTAAEAFRVAVTAIDVGGIEAPELVCVHRFRSHVVLNPPTVDTIFGSNVHARIGTQRRRLGKNRF